MSGIPTIYRNRRFRSRLEARWAAFFDQMGWRWEYEPFDLNGWVPDFIIMEHDKVLVEVKPIWKFLPDDRVVMMRSPLPRTASDIARKIEDALPRPPKHDILQGEQNAEPPETEFHVLVARRRAIPLKRLLPRIPHCRLVA
jgi:hypothetical protein